MRAPVILMIFNRPDLTERVFAAIAEARPPRLFVVADGPRPGKPDDVERCAAARAVIERCNWECDVKRNYSDVNLGCGKRVASGISWAFEQVPQAIILEDDCQPHPSFFRFCDDLLERYRDDSRVMQISGFNAWAGLHPTPYSYYFSRLVCCWGWATWARAWRHHDMEMPLWPALRETEWLAEVSEDPRFVAEFSSMFDGTAAGLIDTWDYQWSFAFWCQSGLSIYPRVNLVSNLGFRDDATHTSCPENMYANLQAGGMTFPLQHPPCVFRDQAYDRLAVERHFFRPRLGLYERARTMLASWVPAPLRRLLKAGVLTEPLPSSRPRP